MNKVVKNGEARELVKEEDIVEENFGEIGLNYGQIKKNYGTVIINRGEIEENCKGAIVKQNLGKVKSNSGFIVRDYTNDSAKIGRKVDSVAVKGGIKYGVKY